MKTHYVAGKYAIKYKGRGIVYANLTKTQAKALFDIFKSGQMEFEDIDLIKSKYGDEFGDKKRYCNRCNSLVETSTTPGYNFQCKNCDEDLYTFETYIK